jgi:wee1-like protein kinase
MDIKPDNIFLTKRIDVTASTKESSSHSHHNLSSLSHHNRSVHSLAEGDDGFDEHDYTYDSDSDDCPEADACYKIGDLGLLTHAFGREVEEGDCRYMAPELLNEETEKDLTKTDIYALGMTLIEILSGKSLPKNGNEWHEIRKSSSPLSLPSTSPGLCRLIQRMIDLDPSKRPSAAFIVQQSEVRSSCDKTKAQLKRELNSSMQKIKELEEQLNKRSSI